MKKFLSITLSVVFVLILAVIPALARNIYFNDDIIELDNNRRLFISFEIDDSKYAEAYTAITRTGGATYTNCMSCIVVTELDGSGYSVAAVAGSLSATAGYNVSSIWNDLSYIGSEHYVAFDLNGYLDPYCIDYYIY